MDLGTLGHGFFFEELPVGTRFRSGKRTITEPDLDDWLKRLRTQLSVLLPVRIDAYPEA